MRGQKGTLERMKRSGGGAGDTVAIRDAKQRGKVYRYRNSGQLGHFRTSSTPPRVLQVLQGGSSYTGLRVPAFVCVKTKKKRLTT